MLTKHSRVIQRTKALGHSHTFLDGQQNNSESFLGQRDLHTKTVEEENKSYRKNIFRKDNANVYVKDDISDEKKRYFKKQLFWGFLGCASYR